MYLQPPVHSPFIFHYIAPNTYLRMIGKSLHFLSWWITTHQSVEGPYCKLWITPRTPELVPWNYEWSLSSNCWTISLLWAQGWTRKLFTSTCCSRNKATSYVLHWVGFAIVTDKRWAIETPRHFSTLYFIKERWSGSSPQRLAHGIQSCIMMPVPIPMGRIVMALWFHEIYPSIDANCYNEMILWCHPQSS